MKIPTYLYKYPGNDIEFLKKKFGAIKVDANEPDFNKYLEDGWAESPQDAIEIARSKFKEAPDPDPKDAEAVQEGDETGKKAESEQPKKRGRPPKVKADELD